MDITFLDLEDVLAIHADQISRYGGNCSVRDMGLVESAIAVAQASFAGQFAHVNIYEMAAAYLYHLVMNHPFVDGNKRTGTVCAIAFLKLNGINVKMNNEKLSDFVIEIAKGQKNKTEITKFLKQNSHR
jgi:death-on-curing protein